MDWRRLEHWQELQAASLERPGMWVPRPYVDGLMTLWLGFGLGAKDDGFERFTNWLQCTRYPAPDGSKSPLAPNALIRRAVTGEPWSMLTEGEDSRALDLLRQLVDEFQRKNAIGG